MSEAAPRVLYCAFDVVPGPKGASVHITHFTQGLVQAGYAVQLFTAGNGVLPAEDTYCGARIRRIHSDGNFLERAQGFGQAMLDHLAEGHRYDVVHFRSIWSGLPLVEAQRQYGYRTLFEVNGLPSIELKYHYPALRGSSLIGKLRRQEVETLARADHIICPSQVTAQYITSLGVAPQRVTVIPNGVDTTLFAPRPVPPADPPILLYVGTLASWQGLELLLEALPFILARRPVRVRIVGRGRKARRKRLTRLVHRWSLEDVVSFEGARPHDTIPEAINQATICVAPLTFNDRNVTQGCCPIKVLEYLACRKPVVASNLPVVRELVREGMDALLFAPDDPVDLARCVLTLLEDPALAQSLAEAGYRRVQKHFTWQKAQQRLLEVYQAIL